MNKAIRVAISLMLCLSFHPHSFGLPTPQIKKATPHAAAPGITITAEAENPSVAFGDPLRIRVIVQNNSGGPVSFMPGNLRLNLTGWRRGSGWSSGESEGPPLVINGHGTQSALLLAGSSVTLTSINTGLTEYSLGFVTVDFELTSGDDASAALLGTPTPLSVEIEIKPSAFLATVWAARTPAERNKLLPRVRELLRSVAAEGAFEGTDATYTLRYTGGYILPMLEALMHDDDPIVREQAILVYASTAMMGFLAVTLDPINAGKRPTWVKEVVENEPTVIKESTHNFAMAALNDGDARVRIAAIRVLTDYDRSEQDAPPIDAIKTLAKDADAGVRVAAQKYLAKFAAQSNSVETVTAAVTDDDASVRAGAIEALEHSPEPPPLASLKQAFKTARGEAATRLVWLLFEQENDELPATLLEGFKQRSPEERLAIITAIAGHTDAAALELTTLALQDSSVDVQRAGLLRLLAFPQEKSAALLRAYQEKAPAALRPLAEALQSEITSRRLLPFLNGTFAAQAAAMESTFPSHHGTVPMVSPDGKWVAYTENGWGRPGGSGGLGRSNMVSLVHAVRSDGTGDRLISDMFLAGWMADSKRIASARDGFATICDLDGRPAAEFGHPLPEKWRSIYQAQGDWRKGDLQSRMGLSMPHSKRLAEEYDFESIAKNPKPVFPDFYEDEAFSPDGKWVGPMFIDGNATFMDVTGQKISVPVSINTIQPEYQAIWSPDGKYVLVLGIYQRPGMVFNLQARTMRTLENIDDMPVKSSWEYRKCRANPWSKDGTHLAFIRNGQVWVSKPDGSEARQVTFDSALKAFPTFSRNGNLIAYVAYQPDNRVHFTRLGPTDLWVVGIATTLAARLTVPRKERIFCLDWLDDDTLIFDRLPEEYQPYDKAALKRISLLQ